LQADEEEKKKKEKELREKRGKKAFQKWCRLSQKDMYKSRVRTAVCDLHALKLKTRRGIRKDGAHTMPLSCI
jgi:hypothetical protein